METPNKMIGGIAGAMAQQPGAIAGAAQPGQMQQNPYPNQNALGPAQNQIIPAAYGGIVQGAPFRVEGDSPLGQNAFFAALQDAKKSGAKTFNVGDKTFPVK